MAFLALAFLYILFFIFGILLPLFLVSFVIFGIFSEIKGAPFVPTSNQYLKDILEKAKLKKDQTFIELGSGDGRVTRFAVKNFEVRGVGIDIHPILVWYSILISKLQKLKNIQFLKNDFFKYNLQKADILFLFLLPKTLKKLAPKFLKECKKGSLVISHGFKIPGFENYLTDSTPRKDFPTYYYKIT